MRTQRCVVATLLLVAGLAACSEPAAPPTPTSFEFAVTDTVHVREGHRLDLGATSGGRSVSTLVRWETRDTSVVQLPGVTPDGVVLARRPGETFVIGTLGTFVDSVLVIARTAVLNPGQTRVQSRRDVRYEMWGNAAGYNVELVHRRPDDRGWIDGFLSSGTHRLSLVGHLRAGTIPLVPPTSSVRDIVEGDARENTFFVWEHTRQLAHVADGGRIVIEEYDVPPGAITGSIKGYVSATATAYRYNYSTGIATPTGERSHLFAEFYAGVRTMIHGWMTLQFDGGPRAGQTLEMIAGAAYYNGELYLVANRWEDPDYAFRGRIAQPRVGTTAVESLWQRWYSGEGGPFPLTTFWLNTTIATSGTLTLTESSAPHSGEHLFPGVITGELDLKMLDVTQEPVTFAYIRADSFAVRATFHAPVVPAPDRPPWDPNVISEATAAVGSSRSGPAR